MTSTFEQRMRRLRLINTVISTLSILLMVAGVAGLGWAITHPESIGAFFGRMAAAFHQEQHGA